MSSIGSTTLKKGNTVHVPPMFESYVIHFFKYVLAQTTSVMVQLLGRGYKSRACNLQLPCYKPSLLVNFDTSSLQQKLYGYPSALQEHTILDITLQKKKVQSYCLDVFGSNDCKLLLLPLS